MWKIIMFLLLSGYVATVNADDRRYDADRHSHRRIMKELRELKHEVRTLREDMAKIRELLSHRRGAESRPVANWACTIEAPWNAPTYYGIGVSKAEATGAVMEKCVRDKNRNAGICKRQFLKCQQD